MTVAPASTPVAAAAVAAPRRPPRWLGLLLVLPALVLLAVSYVELTVWTVRGSFQRLGDALPPAVAVALLLAALVLQLAYLDRVALRVGRDGVGRAGVGREAAELPRDETAGP